MKRTVHLVSLVFIALLLAGCDLLSRPTTSQAPRLPEMPGYKVVDTRFIADYLQQIGVDSNQSELAGSIDFIDGFIRCYGAIEAVQSRIYSNEANALSSGAVVIADRNALLDPRNLLQCLGSDTDNSLKAAAAAGIQPCSANYTVARDNNEYYILYLGTTEAICHDFCSNLEECTAH